MKAKNNFKNSKVYVWKETFAIVKAKKSLANAFAVIKDKDEITVIIKQSKINKDDIIEINKNWKIFTLDIVFSLDVVGITAKVSTALAKEGISIMPIAAYSKDHFLIKNKDLVKAKKVFKNLNCIIEEKN